MPVIASGASAWCARSPRQSGKYVAVLGDLQGPKIRIQRFRDGPCSWWRGSASSWIPAWTRSGGSIEVVGVAYAPLSKDVGPGDVLLLDDGFITLTVERVAGSRIHCSVTQGGRLADNKGINKQGGGLSAPALTDKDREDVRRAAALGVDWLAVSFVRRAEDLHEARALLREAGQHCAPRRQDRAGGGARPTSKASSTRPMP